MKIICSKQEYENLQKEVCYIMNDLKQLTEMLCSSQYEYEYVQNANASYSSLELCDRLKTCLAQINFIMYNKAQEGDVINGNTNSTNIDDSSVFNNTVDTIPEDVEQL